MKKFAIVLFSIVLGAMALAQEEPGLENIPPTYENNDGEFYITLPMQCSTKVNNVLNGLKSAGYKVVFLGQAESMSGGTLSVTIFLHEKDSDYFILMLNSDADGICQLSRGDYGMVFELPKISL